MKTLCLVAASAVLLSLLSTFPKPNSALEIGKDSTTDWCLGIGQGVPIVIEFPPEWTPEELMENLGFSNSILGDWAWLLRQWNPTTKFERGKPINRSILRACYYWSYLPVYDSCTVGGKLDVCLVGKEWIPIYPSRWVNWYLPELPKHAKYDI